MAHDVFISYAKEDASVAKLICQMLESRQLSCWIAPRDVPPGREWAEAVVAAIENAKALVLIFSEHANESAAVRAEVDRAFNMETPVFPFRVKEVEPSGSLSLYIANVHWIDAFTPPIEQQIGRLAVELVSMLGKDSHAADGATGSGVAETEDRDPSSSAPPKRSSQAPLKPPARASWCGKRQLAITSAVACCVLVAIAICLWSPLRWWNVGETNDETALGTRPSVESDEEPSGGTSKMAAEAGNVGDDGTSPDEADVSPSPKPDERGLPEEFQELVDLHVVLKERVPDESYLEYINAEPTTPTGKSWKIYVQPLGEFRLAERKIIDTTADFLNKFCDLPVVTLEDMPLDSIPENAMRDRDDTEQTSAGYLLESVLRPRIPKGAAVYIAFTTSDLWPGEGPDNDWNYVFGLASYHDRLGLWSIHRYGDPGENAASFRACLLRTLKIGTSLTCAMFSMADCGTYRCNMNERMSLAELDDQPLWLCPRCLGKLCWAAELDPEQRFERLTGFCKNQGLEVEREFYEKSLHLMRGE